MTLPQAVGVIMGANIGTTITGQLIALDIGVAAPAIALVGVIMVVFLKKEKTNAVGMIVGGLGILFIGMGMMSDAMAPLRDDPHSYSLITAFNNPIIAVQHRSVLYRDYSKLQCVDRDFTNLGE